MWGVDIFGYKNLIFEQDFISHFLPANILNYFVITDIKELGYIKEKQDSFYVYLEEKNELPQDFVASDYESKGFAKEKIIQDFPIRGRALFLVLRRRIWRLKSDKNKTIKKDFSFLTEGSNLSKELTDFLKETGGDPSRYDEEFV